MRIKEALFSVMMVIAAFSLASCNDEKEHIESSWGSGVNVKNEILFDGNSSQSLNIRAASKPTLTTDAEWIKIGEVKSMTTGIYTVEITVEPNTTGELRTADISVICGKETETVKVTQTFSDLIEVKGVDPDGLLDAAGGTFTIRYVATGTPAVNLPEWISQVGNRAIIDGTLTFSYRANNTGKEREGMIVLAVGKGAVANVTVRQGVL